MTDRLAFLVAPAALVILLAAAAVRGPRPPAAQSEKFGRIDFPTSGSAAAQPHFLRGVAALHNFEYEEALESFRQAQALDPGFAMAYWGEAMAHNQTLWAHEELDAARDALARLGRTKDARPPTPRERAYLDAVEILFGEGDKPRRNAVYADAMRRLAGRYPDDHEAASFHALALLATTQRGIQGLASEGHDRHALVGSDVQRQAAAILQKVLAANPKHPGAAHYLIHTWDDPAHAAQALPVARTYARIAPAASHALHMPAHIFVQLGLWDEASAADAASYAASDAWVRHKGLPPSMRDYHSLAWLQYEYLQQGRYREAGATLDAIEPVAAESDLATLKGTAATMRARQVVETGRWTLLRGRTRFDNTDELFAIGMSAARVGDQATAGMARDELARRATAERSGDRWPLVAILERQLAALIAIARDDAARAIAALDQAIEAERRLPPPLGPPALVKPSGELAGELLLELGRAAEAAPRFEAALERYPNRSRSVLGLARAFGAAGDRAASRARYEVFVRSWRQADRDLPELAEARAALR